MSSATERSESAVQTLRDALAAGGANRAAVSHAAVAVADTGDPAAAPQLQALLSTAPDWAVYWLTRAIRQLTGHHPAPPQNPRDLAEIRELWRRLDLASPPQTAVSWSRSTASRVEAIVDNGRGLFALKPDELDARAYWTEWDYSWRHLGQRIYQVGNICDTCESCLIRVGWSPKEAAEFAQAVRAAVADVRTLDDPTLTALEPLLSALASSRYQVRLIDLPLIAGTVSQTWFASATYQESENTATVFHPPYRNEPIQLVIAPTQEPEPDADPDTDPRTIARYKAAITRGERPAIVVAAHVSQTATYDYETDTERLSVSVTGFIIDGHHKLAAYLELGVTPRLILICDRAPTLPTAADPIGAFDALIDEAGGCDAA